MCVPERAEHSSIDLSPWITGWYLVYPRAPEAQPPGRAVLLPGNTPHRCAHNCFPSLKATPEMPCSLKPGWWQESTEALSGCLSSAGYWKLRGSRQHGFLLSGCACFLPAVIWTGDPDPPQTTLRDFTSLAHFSASDNRYCCCPQESSWILEGLSTTLGFPCLRRSPCALQPTAQLPNWPAPEQHASLYSRESQLQYKLFHS